MKTYIKIFLTLGLLFCILNAFSQNLKDTSKSNFIKTQYAEINKNLKSYKRIEKTDTTETTEGNEVLLYYKGKEVKKIAATYFGETGKARQEYYFINDQLIFCYCVDYHYDIPFNVKGGGEVTAITEERFYLDNG